MARGILTPNERKFLQGEKKCSSNMVRYFRSNIVRKTQKSLEDLDLIFRTCYLWQIFGVKMPFINDLVKEAVRYQYSKNYVKEFQSRLKRRVKLQIDKEIISERTREQLNKMIDSILSSL